MAYLEQNRREYELTTHVSLARLDPLALLSCKATGVVRGRRAGVAVRHRQPRPATCAGSRRSASRSRAVTGPYTGVHCTLSLLRSSVRVSSLAGDQYARNEDGDDDRFRDFAGAIQSIVTSSAQNDSGLFEANLRDDRYLPFEGAGAISTWRLELPNDVPQFDFETHLRRRPAPALHGARGGPPARRCRVAREGGCAPAARQPAAAVQPELRTSATSGTSSGSAADDASRTLELTVSEDDFPYWLKRLGMDDTLVGDVRRHRLVEAQAHDRPGHGRPRGRRGQRLDADRGRGLAGVRVPEEEPRRTRSTWRSRT